MQGEMLKKQLQCHVFCSKNLNVIFVHRNSIQHPKPMTLRPQRQGETIHQEQISDLKKMGGSEPAFVKVETKIQKLFR